MMTTDDRRPTTDDRRPTTDDRRPTTDDRRHWPVKFLCTLLIGIAACTTPNPNRRRPHNDAGVDAPGVCIANEFLRCEGAELVRCNAQGSAEVSESCALGCNDNERRCNDISPSNGLAVFLDQASGQPDLNLGDSAAINTDTGEVTVGGAAVAVTSDTSAQPVGPTIRVLIVGTLSANKVVVTGSNALAIVSNGDIRINDLFDLSAKGTTAGAGAFDDGDCIGKAPPIVPNRTYIGGTGGGGFGSPGGRGGEGRNSEGYREGGAGGTPSGSPQLIPLRGGCSGGGTSGGRGGGALQLVSRSQIVVGGIVASNGSSYYSAGSGGGILLEAPIVDVVGRVVANGASAGVENSGDCKPGQNGRLDAQPALGSPSCSQFILLTGSGGNGAALNVEATNGGDAFGALALGGAGGGGVGRVRINTAPGGQRGSGLFSPNPTNGDLATR